MSTKASLIPKSKATNAYELLSEVCALITAEPKRYDQRTYIKRGHGKHFPSCGTVGCVAGWIATLKGPKHFTYGHTNSIARRILGADQDNVLGVAVDDLFDGGANGEVEGQTRKSAQAGVRMIRAFQKANAAQLKAKKV